jgi:ATP-dependent protease Clp ATPase subunit
MWHRKATSISLRCSLCHKPKDQVEQLLAGPQGAYMCNICVDCCQQVMRDRAREAASFPSALKRCVIVFAYSTGRRSQLAKA